MHNEPRREPIMLKVDSILAADTNYKPKPRITHYTESAENKKTDMSFGDYLNVQLQEKIVSAQAQMSKSQAASVLAWYYPPVMIASKTGDKD